MSPVEPTCRHAISLGRPTGPSQCERPVGHVGMHRATVEWWDPPRYSAAPQDTPEPVRCPTCGSDNKAYPLAGCLAYFGESPDPWHQTAEGER